MNLNDLHPFHSSVVPLVRWGHLDDGIWVCFSIDIHFPVWYWKMALSLSPHPSQSPCLFSPALLWKSMRPSFPVFLVIFPKNMLGGCDFYCYVRAWKKSILCPQAFWSPTHDLVCYFPCPLAECLLTWNSILGKVMGGQKSHETESRRRGTLGVTWLLCLLWLIFCLDEDQEDGAVLSCLGILVGKGERRIPRVSSPSLLPFSLMTIPSAFS